MISFFSKANREARTALRPPPFLLGAALIFWGWQTDLMIWALPMALLLELPQYIRTRWEFSHADLSRIFDLGVVIGVGVGVILYNSESRLQFFFKWLQSMPFFFLPITLAQVYGSREKMPLSIFSWVLRRTPDRPLAKKSFNVTWLYFSICLMAVSSTNGENPIFYFGVLTLVVLALSAVRPVRLSLAFWLILVTLAGTGGYFGHKFLHSGQADLEVAIGNWLANAARRRVDTRESRTAIGQNSRLRLTGKILLRVQPEPGQEPPALLREATYQSYHRGVWQANDSQFDRVFVDPTDIAVLHTNAHPKHDVRIGAYYDGGKGLVALPVGVSELQDYPALLQTNRLGSAMADGGPGFINLLARYDPDHCYDPAPSFFSEVDYDWPERDDEALGDIVQHLGLMRQSTDEKLKTIAQWFQTNFTYTLDGRVGRGGQSPIVQFLTETRAGHCEHFATAAVLLLRKADVAARYAVGYAVPQSGRHGNVWYVRERHGHAWVMVYHRDRNRWEEFDPTPSSREEIEESRASALEGISDFGSTAWFKFSEWRWSKTDYTHYASWLLVPLILFLAWRILSGKRRRHTTGDSAADDVHLWLGLDSELYLINRHLSVELHRQPNEPLFDWEKRLSGLQLTPLNRAFELHRRFRFDPQGLPAVDRAALKSEVQQWLADFEAQKKAQTEKR